MTKAPSKNGLGNFYKERFNADPFALVDYFFDDISSAAAEVSLKWSSIAHQIQFNGDKLKKYAGNVKIEAIDKKYRGKLMAWGEIKTAPSTAELASFDYPFLTFSNNALGSSTWSGLGALAELYKREGGRISDEQHEKWKAQQQAKRAAREAKRLADEQRAKERAERVLLERLAYERAWHTGERGTFTYETKRGDLREGFVEVIGEEDGTAPYLVKKQIGAIVSRFKMLRMRDSHGEFTAVPMYAIDGTFRGLQRLYEGMKLQGTGVDMDGAHCVIGDLETAKIRYSVEGFATGASIYLAELEAGNGDEVAVVVTFNVDNLLKVLRAYSKRYPAWRFHNAADNDQWTAAGNAGVLAALEAHRDLKHPGIVPNFAASLELFGCSAQQIAELRAQNRAPVVGFCSDELAAFKAAGKGPTDWNDYAVHFGLKATAKALRARDSVLRAEKDWFDYSRQRLSYCGHVSGEKQALQAVTAGMMLSPIKFSGRQVVDLVLRAIPANVDNAVRFKVRSRALWLAKIKLKEAAQLRGFSSEALARPGVQHLKIEGVVNPEHGGLELPQHLAGLIESLEGVIIVRAPMGSGKTEKLIAPLMKASSRAGYIAHRISLMDDAHARLDAKLDKDGKPVLAADGSPVLEDLVQHYKQLKAWQVPHVSHMVCCVNSLTRPMFYNGDERNWFTTLETLCIDEASQVLRHVATGPVDGRVKVMETLVDAVAACKRVLLCDADANDSLIEFCQLARPGQPVTVLEVEGPAAGIVVQHAEFESMWQLALEQIGKGKRVLVANDSAESAKKMAAVIEDYAKEGRLPPKRVLLVHADSKADPDVEAFLSNPNAEAPKYDVLLYSPAISSGVSMKTPHFDCHFGLFSGSSVSPSDAVQMLRRDRTARHYFLGIGHTSAQRETDREAIWRGLLKSDEIAFELELEETAEHIIQRRRKTAFDQLYLTAVTSENRARNNFANNLLLMLVADGYKVEALDVNALGYDSDDLVKAARKNRKLGGELVFDKRMTLIESVATPDEEQFLKLNRQEVRSEAETAQIDRYHIETQLGVDQITADDVAFYDDRGIAKVVALELLQATAEQARAYDKAQAKARVTLTLHRWKTPAHALLCRVFEILGIDRYTGEGEFNAAQCRQVLEYLTSSQEQVDHYNALKLGRYLPGTSAKLCATTLVKSILDRLGLATQKRKTNGQVFHAVNPDNWNFVTAYVQKRAAKNTHSLTTHEHDGAHQPRLALEASEGAQATAGAASSGRDTLQDEGIAQSEKYPLGTMERIYAAASRLTHPLGISLTRLVGALTPDLVDQLAKEGAEKSRSLGFTLAYAAKLLRS
ncbi:plasmid replication protein, CyRepA1 family [Pseudomonas aeruginosa]|uniref:plasmid replication protein, CyRepA1 family n=1 Tax=Pseudomonas aeruginosa TaxID=287 RepID=UPI000689DA06|nr:plasmid replication protein, CyRepA1 family [Pseudomonas aeruginosa]